MSTLTVSNISNGSVTTTTANVVNGCAKAWVNFNGTTSPGTIRASYNVSSVTKNGTGDYTLNFTTALTDANYSVAGCGQIDTTGNDGNRVTLGPKRTSTALSAGSLNIVTGATQLSTALDPTMVGVAVFR